MSVKGNTQILEEAGNDVNLQAFGDMVKPFAKCFPLGILFYIFGGIWELIIFVAVFWVSFFCFSLCGELFEGKPKKRRRRTRRRR